MLIKANTRKDLKGRYKYLLQNRQNEQAVMFGKRGVAFTDDPEMAYKQLGLITSKHKKPFLSVSINPAKEYEMTPEQWQMSIDIIERRLKLKGQPYIAVIHEKRGEDGELRQHMHVDWRRVKNGSLISDSNMRHKLVEAKKEMEINFGHTRTKDYDRQDYAIKQAQGRMAQRDTPPVVEQMQKTAQDISAAEQEAIERMQQQRDRQRGRGLGR